jgi:hypothetical protein
MSTLAEENIDLGSDEHRGGAMGSLSIWHWVVTVLLIGSPIMGIVRGLKNGSALHAVLSAFVPVDGLIYFFAAQN